MLLKVEALFDELKGVLFSSYRKYNYIFEKYLTVIYNIKFTFIHTLRNVHRTRFYFLLYIPLTMFLENDFYQVG